jgi:hypothetical protein
VTAFSAAIVGVGENILAECCFGWFNIFAESFGLFPSGVDVGGVQAGRAWWGLRSEISADVGKYGVQSIQTRKREFMPGGKNSKCILIRVTSSEAAVIKPAR